MDEAVEDKKQENALRTRFPEWLKKRLPCGGGGEVRELLASLNLNTVCRSAHCPNMGECYSRGRATFLIMGSVCTRNCRFCAVGKGEPQPLDAGEPARLAEAAQKLKLKHVVITSVTRDDLPDGGAAHFAATIRAVRAALSCTIEVLTPDFMGNEKSLDAVGEAAPDVFNHNIETVSRLYPEVRPMADYGQSLRVLAYMRKHYPQSAVKSGIMLGLGEKRDEVSATLRDLHEHGCQMLTAGQYLAPSPAHHPVVEFVHPDVFASIAEEAKGLGFEAVASSPFVRSSYNAEESLAEAENHKCGCGNHKDRKPDGAQA